MAFVLPAVLPNVLSIAIDDIVAELPIVVTAIGPVEHPLALFLAMDVVASVLTSIWPCLHPVAMLLVIEPLSGIDRPVGVDILAFPVGLVVLPLSYVYIPVLVDQSSGPVGHIIFPVTSIDTSVIPDLLAFTCLLAIEPSPDVDIDTACLTLHGPLVYCLGGVVLFIVQVLILPHLLNALYHHLWQLFPIILYFRKMLVTLLILHHGHCLDIGNECFVPYLEEFSEGQFAFFISIPTAALIAHLINLYPRLVI